MIDQQIYTREYIQSLTDDIKADRNLVERSLYAFSLLEALSRVKLPFIFKGGTCLLLLLIIQRDCLQILILLLILP